MRLLRFTCFILILLIRNIAPVCGGEVAVVMSSDAKVYLEVLEGFREVVRHQTVNVQTLTNHPDGWRDQLRKLRTVIEPDIIVAIGTSALQAAAAEITNIPIVHAMVFNPFSALPNPAKKVIGISMNPSAAQVIALLRELNPKYRRVGTMVDPSRAARYCRRRDRYSKKKDFSLLPETFAQPAKLEEHLNLWKTK